MEGKNEFRPSIPIDSFPILWKCYYWCLSLNGWYRGRAREIWLEPSCGASGGWNKNLFFAWWELSQMSHKILFFCLNEDSWIFCCFLFLVPFFCLNEDSWLLNYPPLFNIICSVIQFWLFTGEVAIDFVSFFLPIFSLFLWYFVFRLVSMVLIGFSFSSFSFLITWRIDTMWNSTYRHLSFPLILC